MDNRVDSGNKLVGRFLVVEIALAKRVLGFDRVAARLQDLVASAEVIRQHAGQSVFARSDQHASNFA